MQRLQAPPIGPSDSVADPNIRVLARSAGLAVASEARQIVGAGILFARKPVDVRATPRVVRHVFAQVGAAPVGGDWCPRRLLAQGLQPLFGAWVGPVVE